MHKIHFIKYLDCVSLFYIILRLNYITKINNIMKIFT